MYDSSNNNNTQLVSCPIVNQMNDEPQAGNFFFMLNVTSARERHV
jgi:hypothetical protein